MKSIPFFSIVIPFCYKNRYSIFQLKRCIESIRSQSFNDFEIIVSTPNYFAKLNKRKFFENIRVIDSKKKDGYIHDNVNSAILAAKGKWIKILFSDDFFENHNGLKNLYNFINKNNYQWVILNSIHITENKNDLIKPLIPYYQKHILSINTIGSPSALAFCNKDSLLFDTKSWMRLDVDFYFKLNKKFGMPGLLSNTYIVNELHENQESNLLRKISSETKKKLNNELNYLSEKYNYRLPNKLKLIILKIYIKLERRVFQLIFNLNKSKFEGLKVPIFDIF